MKNKTTQLLMIFMVSLFIIPQITFAAWWNPVSWKIFNKKSETKTKQIIIATTTPNSTADLGKAISSKTKSFADTSEKKINTSSEQSSAKSAPKPKNVVNLNTEKSSNSTDKKQESLSPKTTGGGSLINGVTSGARPVNPTASSASSIQAKKATEEQKIAEIQKQIEKTKAQIDQMATVSAIWWKTASPISTQTYFYQGVEIKIFVLTNDGDYRIEFVNPENNQKYSRYLKDTQANLEKGELNKKIEQIINDDLGASPAVVAIDTFLLSPTIDNLRSFCDIAKITQGTEQKRVLNETRTDFVMKTLTLYEQSQINDLCDIAFGIRKLKSGEYSTALEFRSFFQWVVYDPSYILEFNSNDSDSVREIKINFNNYWKNISAYKLIGFYVYSTSSERTTPNKVIEKQISRYIMSDGELSNAGKREWERITRSYVIPEKILTEIRRQLISARR